jgi:hypothetical protein
MTGFKQDQRSEAPTLELDLVSQTVRRIGRSEAETIEFNIDASSPTPGDQRQVGYRKSPRKRRARRSFPVRLATAGGWQLRSGFSF